MFIADLKDLHSMDLGAHIHTMEEWNENTRFNWQEACVYLHGFYTRVVQDDGEGGLHVCTYTAGGEGDLRSLRVYTDVPSAQLARSASRMGACTRRQHIRGTEMWDHSDRPLPAPR